MTANVRLPAFEVPPVLNTVTRPLLPSVHNSVVSSRETHRHNHNNDTERRLLGGRWVLKRHPKIGGVLGEIPLFPETMARPLDLGLWGNRIKDFVVDNAWSIGSLAACALATVVLKEPLLIGAQTLVSMAIMTGGPNFLATSGADAATPSGKNEKLLDRINPADRGGLVIVNSNGSLRFARQGEPQGQLMWRVVRTGNTFRITETNQNNFGQYRKVAYKEPPALLTDAVAAINEFYETAAAAKASALPPLPQQFVGVWLIAKGGKLIPVQSDQSPQSGDLRWQIEKTRDGFRAGQVGKRIGNSDNWSPLKVRDTKIPDELQAKLDELNGKTAAPVEPQIATEQGRVADTSSTTSADSDAIIKHNIEVLAGLPDNSPSRIYVIQENGWVGSGRLEYYMEAFRDEVTGLRTWKPTPFGSQPTPENFTRAIEKLNEPAKHLAQTVKKLDSQSKGGVRLTFNRRTGKWEDALMSVRGFGYEPGQQAFWLLPERDSAGLVRWIVHAELIYSIQLGWRAGSEKCAPLPPDLDAAVKVANANLARDFAARKQDEQRFVGEIMKAPATPISTLSDDEIRANARTAQTEDEMGRTDHFSIEIDGNGRAKGTPDFSGTKFRAIFARIYKGEKEGLKFIIDWIDKPDSWSVKRYLNEKGEADWEMASYTHSGLKISSKTPPPSIPMDAIVRTVAEINRQLNAPARVSTLEKKEIEKNAAVVFSQLERSSVALPFGTDQFYLDPAGYLTENPPETLGLYFKIDLGWNAKLGTVSLTAVTALHPEVAVEDWVWRAVLTPGTNQWLSVNRDRRGTAPLTEFPYEFPGKALDLTLAAVRHRLTVDSNAKTIVPLIMGSPKWECSFVMDSTTRVDGKEGQQFRVELRWDEEYKWPNIIHITAYKPNGTEVSWQVDRDERGTLTIKYNRDHGDPIITTFNHTLPKDFPLEPFRDTMEAIKARMIALNARVEKVGSPAAPIKDISDSEIAANADAVYQVFATPSSLSSVFYADDAGRLSAEIPLSEIYFQVVLGSGDTSHSHPYLTIVRAYSRGGKWLWHARSQNDGWVVTTDKFEDRSQLQLPSEFPMEAMQKTLDVVQQKLMISENAEIVFQGLLKDRSLWGPSFNFDSEGRINGRTGSPFKMTVYWNEDLNDVVVREVVGYTPNWSNTESWKASLEKDGWVIQRGVRIERSKASLPPEYPAEAIQKTMAVVRERMIAARGVQH